MIGIKNLTKNRRGLIRSAFASLLAFLMLILLVGCEGIYEPYVMDPQEDLSAPVQSDSLSDERLSSDSLTYADTADATTTTSPPEQTEPPAEQVETIDEDGFYYSKDEVALYIHTYDHLPSNFISKKEANELGWSGGSLEKYAEGYAIGGDRFGNREGLLPSKSGRVYTECDIDTKGKSSRGAKRIVFSNDGYIFYTDDHYESFTQLYP